MDKHQKYKILARFPGLVGRRYKAKLSASEARKAAELRFTTACKNCIGMNCIDIGANVGVVTKAMAEFAGHVFAIEPDPIAFGHLSSETAGLPNVTLIKACAGVSNSDTQIFRDKDFHLNPKLRTQGTSMFVASHLNAADAVQCKQIDIAKFITELNSDVGILKIDAEGAELPILESILTNEKMLTRIRYIFAETHERFWPQWHGRYEELHKLAAHVSGTVVDLSWH